MIRVNLILLAVLVQLLGFVTGVRAAPFSAPDMEGFMLHAERNADGDGDGVNETRISQYLNTSGDSVVSLSSKGVIWAWSLDSRDSESGNRNYVIRDSNCDGQFDEIYGLDDDFHVPECLK